MVILRAALLCLLATVAAAEPSGKTLEIIASPRARSIIEGEMIPVTIRGVYDTKVALEKMTILPSDRFDWVQLAKDDWHNERIGGKNFLVVERKLAVFARQTGVARFGPVEHDLTVINAASRREPALVRANPLELSIAPMPEDAPFHRPHGWRFAASRLTLTDELSTDPAKLADGETVTRRVTLRAEGALPEMLPPRPVVSEPWLITFAAPVERSLELTPDGPVASVIWTWQFRPETGEPGVLGPVEIPYFDTVSRRVKSVEIPALPIAYASAAGAQMARGDIRGGTVWAGLAALLAGAVAGSFLLGVAGVQRGGALHRLWRHYSPLPRWQLRQAARAGDLLRLRAAAAALPTPLGEQAAALQALDRAIYARPGAVFDAGAFVRVMLRRKLFEVRSR